MDSLYLTATSYICLYIFFQRVFAIPIFSPLFDPMALFEGISLYMAHSDPVPPHMVQPIAVVLSQPTPPESLESEPPQMSAFSFSSSSAPDDGYAPGGPGFMGLIMNRFLSLGSA